MQRIKLPSSSPGRRHRMSTPQDLEVSPTPSKRLTASPAHAASPIAGGLGTSPFPLVDRKRHVVGVLGWRATRPNGSRMCASPTTASTTAVPRSPSQLSREDGRTAAGRCRWQPRPAFISDVLTQEPGELCNNVANTRITDDLLAHKYFQRIAHFANAQMALLRHWKPSFAAGTSWAASSLPAPSISGRAQFARLILILQISPGAVHCRRPLSLGPQQLQDVRSLVFLSVEYGKGATRG
ncbi:hypothetical protein B0H14DRAFT_2577072 [Mycena olivaceomarginata]|nr:hypothetical protein B0H14DRAFT_2577072 [Mycena olivaceomarginata]